MKSIFMVSPNYLETCYEEALKYDFTLQGYGNFKAGSKGLLKINASDVLGFVYLATKLPEDLTDLYEFLYRCDLYGKKKFLFALLDTTGLGILKYEDYPNLSFSLVKIDEVVTDVVINRDIFGTLLLANYEPYALHEEDASKNYNNDVYRLRYKPLISSYILECLKKVNVLDSFENTLLHDNVYHRYKDDESILADFRYYYVKSFFYDNLDNKNLYTLISDEKDSITYGIYKALISVISSNNILESGE